MLNSEKIMDGLILFVLVNWWLAPHGGDGSNIYLSYVIGEKINSFVDISNHCVFILHLLLSWSVGH